MMTDKVLQHIEEEGPTPANWKRLMNEVIHMRELVKKMQRETLQ